MREEDKSWKLEVARIHERRRYKEDPHKKKLSALTYYRGNIDKVRARRRVQQQLHPEKNRDRCKIYRETHPEIIKRNMRNWYKNNQDKVATNNRRYYEENREKILQYSRTWQRENRSCTTCGLFVVTQRGSECATCGGYRVNSAEYEVRDYIKKWHPQAIFDKQIEGSCLKYRPDIFIETPYGVVICEVDEREHQDYDPNCEVIRERNLWEALGCDLTVIRYNPDSFKQDSVNTQRLSQEERLGALFLAIQESIETHRPGLYIQYLWYSPQRIAELEAARSKLPK